MGNHTVGVFVIKALIQERTLIGIVAHPRDLEDGVKYESVYDFGIKNKIPTVRGTPKDEHVLDFLFKNKPDMIWVADYKFILPKEIIIIPKYGAINFHPSLLPHYRGRAPLNWAMINGEKYTGLTVHMIDEGIDSGDIIHQEKIEISKEDYIGDILEKIYPLYYDISLLVLNAIRSGRFKTKKQTKSSDKIYKARKPKDGLITDEIEDEGILRLIKAVSRPYPGAYFEYDDKKIIIWKGYIKMFKSKEESNFGRVLENKDGIIKIKINHNYLISHDWEIVFKNETFKELLFKNKDFYNQRVSKHGYSHLSLNWGSQKNQITRFEILSQIGNLENKNILDFGCGIGDLFYWFINNGINTNYEGIDLSSEMIKLAKKRFPTVKFKCQNLMESPLNKKYDYILASGVFTYSNNGFFQKCLELLYSKCNKGIAFNLLADIEKYKNETTQMEFLSNPDDILKFCKSLSPKVILKNDYHYRDFSIYMYKDENIN